jgi:hypothetical protein
MHQFVTNYPNYSNIPNGGENCSSPFFILPLKAEEWERLPSLETLLSLESLQSLQSLQKNHIFRFTNLHISIIFTTFAAAIPLIVTIDTR